MYGVKQFNLDPGKGLKYLQEKALLQPTPDCIAQFLFSQDRLSKKAIGNYGQNNFCLVLYFFPGQVLTWEGETSCSKKFLPSLSVFTSSQISCLFKLSGSSYGVLDYLERLNRLTGLCQRLQSIIVVRTRVCSATVTPSTSCHSPSSC